MRICDRCAKKHASLHIPNLDYDLCGECTVAFIHWVHVPPPPRPEPLVNPKNTVVPVDPHEWKRRFPKDDCIPCNKEEGEFVEKDPYEVT